MTTRTTTLSAALLFSVTMLVAACGGSSSAKVAPSTTSATTTSTNNRTPGAPGGFANRTPRPAVQTAIAEGTPASALRGPGGRGGGRILGTVATLLGVDPATLQTELQAPGATIAGVAAAHGKDRATVRAALIEAERQRNATAVAGGTLTQADADTMAAQFAARVDAVLDSSGSGPGGGAPPSSP